MVRLEAASHTSQWYAARRGMLTASRMHDACNFKVDGKPSQKRTDYMMDLVAERMTGIATTHFVTAAMQWGIDHEQDAIAAFETQVGALVLPAGLVLHSDIEHFGATPDGFVHVRRFNEDVGRDLYVPVEVKCPTTPVFVEWRLAGEIPDKARMQLIAQMACCDSLHGLFIAYDPRIRVGRNLFWKSIDLQSRDELAEVEAKAKVFLDQTEKMFKEVTENA